MKFGRPDLTRYADRFSVPVALPAAPVTVTFFGVASLLIRDQGSAIMTDGFFTRPSLARVALGRVAPDESRVRGGLARLGLTRLDGVVPVHTHVDHALDSALVADLTGAALLGGGSAANLGRGYGLPADRIVEVADGASVALGDFDVTFVESRHCPPDRFPGPIREPLRTPARAGRFRCGQAWSLVVHHRPTERRLLVQGSAGYRSGALEGHRAEVAYLGVGQLGLQSERYLHQYWDETVRAVDARRVVLIHWDDFFRPNDRPLVALPFAGDDLDATMRVLTSLADADGVDLTFPSIWIPADPWAGLTGQAADSEGS
jgi:L-ascorbate metabolism protein UlaG (beta-lactamase superfamily)